MRAVGSGVIFAQRGPRPSSAGADEENLMMDGDQDQVQNYSTEYNQENVQTPSSSKMSQVPLIAGNDNFWKQGSLQLLFHIDCKLIVVGSSLTRGQNYNTKKICKTLIFNTFFVYKFEPQLLYKQNGVAQVQKRILRLLCPPSHQMASAFNLGLVCMNI